MVASSVLRRTGSCSVFSAAYDACRVGSLSTVLFTSDVLRHFWPLSGLQRPASDARRKHIDKRNRQIQWPGHRSISQPALALAAVSYLFRWRPHQGDRMSRPGFFKLKAMFGAIGGSSFDLDITMQYGVHTLWQLVQPKSVRHGCFAQHIARTSLPLWG